MEHRLEPVRLGRPVFVILLAAVIFQISVHRKIAAIFQSTSVYTEIKEYFPGQIISLMIAGIQVFPVLGAVVEVILGGFVLYFFAWFLQTRIRAVTYVYLYAVASLVLCMRTVINAAVNFATFSSAEVYSMDHLNLAFRFLDPFVLLAAVIVYMKASQLLDLSKNGRLALAFLFLAVQYVKIGLGLITGGSYLTI